MVTLGFVGLGCVGGLSEEKSSEAVCETLWFVTKGAEMSQLV